MGIQPRRPWKFLCASCIQPVWQSLHASLLQRSHPRAWTGWCIALLCLGRWRWYTSHSCSEDSRGYRLHQKITGRKTCSWKSSDALHDRNNDSQTLVYFMSILAWPEFVLQKNLHDLKKDFTVCFFFCDQKRRRVAFGIYWVGLLTYGWVFVTYRKLAWSFSLTVEIRCGPFCLRWRISSVFSSYGSRLSGNWMWSFCLRLLLSG